jgi:hypothetical protein
MTLNFVKQIVCLSVAAVFLTGCSLFTKSPPAPSPTPQVQKLTLDQAPYTTLTISADKKSGLLTGHTFTMKINKLKTDQPTLEYVLLYELPSGAPQGIPGTLDISRQTEIIRDDLLMGSCSKVCRFDDGVTKGTLQMTYRDSSGNAIGDITGDWHLQNNENPLSSGDASFNYELAKPIKGWFVTMSSLGLPNKSPAGVVAAGPFFVSASSGDKAAGKVAFKSASIQNGSKIYQWDGSTWIELTTTVAGDTATAAAQTLGTFILVN